MPSHLEMRKENVTPRPNLPSQPQRLTVYRRDGRLFLEDCNGKLLRVRRNQLRSYLKSECQITRAEAEAMIDAAQEFTEGEFVERKD